MHIEEVRFVGSFKKESQCPKAEKPEFAFIGRSNVGKSSIINMICNRKGVAKVSNTPGKTQSINYFDIDDQWFLVDLPGYGYARTSKKDRSSWEKMIERYLLIRKNLQVAFVLIDIRHDLQDIDREFINWLGENGIPFSIVYTKMDKLKKSQVETHVNKIQQELLKYWNSLPQQFITSSEKHIGREEILQFIKDLANKF